MSDPEAPPGPGGSMPQPGTTATCWFCAKPVTLGSNSPAGWYVWAAPDEPADGRWRCDGGVGPGDANHRTPRTLHMPRPELDGKGNPIGERWAPRYTPDGQPRSPQDAPRAIRTRRTA